METRARGAGPNAAPAVSAASTRTLLASGTRREGPLLAETLRGREMFSKMPMPAALTSSEEPP